MLFFRIASSDVDAFGVVGTLDVKANVSLRLLCVFNQVVKGSFHLEEAVTLGKVADGGQSLGTVAQGTLHREGAAKDQKGVRTQ